jgi:hypothetical protein
VGIEILEVRQEHTASVRGGAFGKIAEEVKIVLNPSTASMDLVRELRELREPGREPQGNAERRHKRSTQSTQRPPSPPNMRGYQPLAVPLPLRDTSASTMASLPPTLSVSKSLPLLAPAASLAADHAMMPWPSGSPPLPQRHGHILPKI